MTGRLVFAFARMNPPTLGHRKLVDRMVEVAEGWEGSHALLVMSRTQGDRRNPLSPAIKEHYARLIVRTDRVDTVTATPELPTMMHWLAHLNARYDELVIVCGDDRVKEYWSLLERYQGIDFDWTRARVVSSGPRADGETSATAVRKMVQDLDYKSFQEVYPGVWPPTLSRMWIDLQPTG